MSFQILVPGQEILIWQYRILNKKIAAFQILVEILFAFTDNSKQINKSVTLIGGETNYMGWTT